MKNLQTKLLLLLITFLVVTAHAADKGGNGGNAVVMPDGQVQFLDLVRLPDTVMLDIDQEDLRAGLKTVLDKNPGFATATYFPFRGTDERSTSVEAKIMAALDSLEFELVNGPLPELNDTGIVVLPWNVEGKIVRLALQNSKTFKVLVDNTYYPKLSRTDKVALLFHEALIRVWHDDYENQYLESTAKIANLVHATMSAGDTDHGLNVRSVSRYLCDAEIMSGENSNFGLTRVFNDHIETTNIPVQVTVFVYDQGRCQAVDATNENPGPAKVISHDFRSTLGFFEELAIWTFHETANPQYRVFYTLEFDYQSIDTKLGPDRYAIEFQNPSRITPEEMDTNAKFKSRLALWTK